MIKPGRGNRMFGAPADTRWRWLNWPVWARLGLAVGYFAALNVMLLAPLDGFESTQLFPHQDKVEHLVAFLCLAVLVRWTVPARFGSGARALATVAAIAAYGLGIEWLQPVLTGGERQRELLDLAGNLLGIAAGWLLFGAGVAAAGAADPTTTGGAVR